MLQSTAEITQPAFSFSSSVQTSATHHSQQLESRTCCFLPYRQLCLLQSTAGATHPRFLQCTSCFHYTQIQKHPPSPQPPPPPSPSPVQTAASVTFDSWTNTPGVFFCAGKSRKSWSLPPARSTKQPWLLWQLPPRPPSKTCATCMKPDSIWRGALSAGALLSSGALQLRCGCCQPDLFWEAKGGGSKGGLLGVVWGLGEGSAHLQRRRGANFIASCTQANSSSRSHSQTCWGCWGKGEGRGGGWGRDSAQAHRKQGSTFTARPVGERGEGGLGERSGADADYQGWALPE